jgi:hypothetical protein
VRSGYLVWVSLVVRGGVGRVYVPVVLVVAPWEGVLGIECGVAGVGERLAFG